MVSAWASKAKAVFGQLAVDEKSNEITAVPALLELLDIKGCIITADAMSCQKEIVAKIVEGEADYTIGLKENQPTLCHAAQEHFEAVLKEPTLYDPLGTYVTTEKGHGRIETRTYYLCTDHDFLKIYRPSWKDLNGIGMMISKVEKNGVITEEKALPHYFTDRCGGIRRVSQKSLGSGELVTLVPGCDVQGRPFQNEG